MALKLPRLQHHVLLAPFTTYQIGGPADFFFTARSTTELVQAITTARTKKVPYFILGTGANILIGDHGYRGLVIHNCANRTHFRGPLLTAEAGATIASLINAAQPRGLSGLEHFAGIPSSLGGAIRQNLHFLSPDRSRTVFIAEVVRSAQVLLENGQLTTLDQTKLAFGYDESLLHHRPVVVLNTTLSLTPASPATINRQISANLAWRQAKQPQLDEFPSCGSVFKKIAGVGAGRLIEQAGLKGARIGKAQVSTQHANYLVNLGGATATQVCQLIKCVQQTVAKQTGYCLEPEIGFVGEF